MIVVVLAESVSEQKASVTAEAVFAVVVMSIFGSAWIHLIMDSLKFVKDRMAECEEQIKEEKPVEQDNVLSSKQSEEEESEDANYSSLQFTKSTANNKIKIKRMRRGRII